MVICQRAPLGCGGDGNLLESSFARGGCGGELKTTHIDINIPKAAFIYPLNSKTFNLEVWHFISPILIDVG